MALAAISAMPTVGNSLKKGFGNVSTTLNASIS